MDLIIRAWFALATLYMMAILLRWLGPWLEIDVKYGRFRWIGEAVDPLLRGVRRILPPLGPLDYAPVAALLLVWMLREVVVRVLFSAA